MTQSKVKVIVFQVVLLLVIACHDNDKNPIPVVTLSVTSINPAVGVAGTTVTITGTGFSVTPTDNHVTFNGTAASITSATTTQLIAVVPPGAMTGAVSVETGGKVVAGPLFTVTPPLVLSPMITGIVPAGGPASTPVTITGENFGTDITAIKVFFNDKEALILNLNNTTITTTIPSKAGSGIVKIVMKGVTYSGPAFLYQTSITVTTIAGSTTSGFQDGPGASARFNGIVHLTTDSKGNIYVVDQGNARIRKITPAGMVSTFAGDGDELHDISQPNGICADGNDNIYVSDRCIIKKITSAGSVSILSGGFVGCGYADGPREEAKFYYPYGLVADGLNNIYVAEISNYDVRKIDLSGNTSTLAGGTSGDENGTGTSAKFSGPHSLTIGESGTLYLSDFGSFKLKKITSSGEVSTLAGSTPGHRDGVGTAAKINWVNGVCRDPLSGNLYFAENEIPTDDSVYVRMVTPLGEVKTLIGTLVGHQDGSEKTAKFNPLLGIACDPNGIIYVSEGSAIRKITIE